MLSIVITEILRALDVCGNGDLTQLERHRRGQHLRQCDLIDCITVFQSEFEKSFICCSVLVKFTCSLHVFAIRERLF